jgi:hypothetical protein
MSPELKAFITSIADCPELELREKSQAAHVLERFAKAAKSMLALIGNALDRVRPYTCELRPMHTVKSAIAQCCSRREVIGHHGLV